MPRFHTKRGTTEIIDKSRVLMRCQVCGQKWSPNLMSGGKFRRGAWLCPNGCTKSTK